jgi:hypothetical protein
MEKYFSVLNFFMMAELINVLGTGTQNLPLIIRLNIIDIIYIFALVHIVRKEIKLTIGTTWCKFRAFFYVIFDGNYIIR